MTLLDKTPSRDPYWISIHTALDLLDGRDRPFHRPDYELDRFKWNRGYHDGPFKELHPGDHALCCGGTSLVHYLYHEYLVSKGHVLTAEELYRLKDLKRYLHHNRDAQRPCIVLDRHGDSYTVCFLTSFNSVDISEDESGVASVLIPCGDAQEGGLRSYPDFQSRWLVPLPVVRERSILRPIMRYGPGWGKAMRQRLSYGELERMRSWVRAKEADFATNHETIRRAEVANWLDSSHRTRHVVRRLRKVKIMQNLHREEALDYFHLFRKSTYHETPRDPPWSVPSPVCNNTAWIVRHTEQEIANASRYLSNVVRPPPPFRLPRPFYAPSLRASTAFVRRRILRLPFTW
ncbi:hypothetical protein DFH07DRAFT_538801 [Mycena maculata]|uniref:Uncharacterized protein n=1 Tax=Mycena maculata TaxID=230809 RepID=A0AAD7K5C4_9AGAR|nr:hypothetical protein DFH07DRAFT_538801 [Mycena maculata]